MSNTNGMNDDKETASSIGNSALRQFLHLLSTTTNITQWGIELPMIAVFGDTSSGKSSLLSNLAMIELPSNHSLTTRCPILLELRRAEKRQARVGIQWKTSSLPEPATEDASPAVFEPRMATEDTWDSIPQFVREAQDHILQQQANQDVQVASDVISLSVEGPNFGLASDHPLTLMDLPGWVQSRGQDDAEDLVQDIQELLQTYIQNPRCIILAVLPANVDFHNSKILSLAQQVDPNASRTIPVITKPDLVDQGGEGDVLELLMGNKIKLNDSNQFHMVKGRGQAALDRNTSIHVALEEETHYFDTVEPWKYVADRTLFGTGELRRKLGDILLLHIQSSVPTILQEIKDKQQTAEAKRMAMGGDQILTTVADRRRFYQDTCARFANQLKSSLSGKKAGAETKTTRRSKHRSSNGKSATASKTTTNNSSQTSTAAAQLHEACSGFTKSIRQGSLNTIRSIVEGAHVRVTSPHGEVRGEVVHLDKDFACIDCLDCDEDADQDDKRRAILFEYRGYTAQQQIEEDEVWSDGNQIFIARKNNIFDSLRRIPLDHIRTDPSWLKEKIVENRTDDLACFLNVDIFKNIIEDFVEHDWRPHCKKLLDATSDILMAAVNDCIESNLPKSTIRYPPLRRYLERQCRVAAEELMQEARKQVDTHLSIETHPYTQDSALFQNLGEARHRTLKRELESALKLDQGKQAVYDTQAIQTIIDGVFERNRRKSVEDHMADEMEIVLEAYGCVATKRVVDRTPMICWQVFRSLSSSIQDSLWSVTDETLSECMRESPEFEKEYGQLNAELEEMNKALDIFESIL
ncbi:Interferon-induced GTP-binding protein [Seminavis robusta]|uniref:Interferon-induced GTP-binding protein n=1 Tax=Seminavis robusta TaxID=568900 RepID=A0A9N8EY22_9STRA|nr:Interferon-induced GTP-binding protein [Seminavis robusta]|eukprot:Sro2229_g319950.1 Interferon-induced GTP-binding protein (808) ;mRNA; r:8276-10791